VKLNLLHEYFQEPGSCIKVHLQTEVVRNAPFALFLTSSERSKECIIKQVYAFEAERAANAVLASATKKTTNLKKLETPRALSTPFEVWIVQVELSCKVKAHLPRLSTHWSQTTSTRAPVRRRFALRQCKTIPAKKI
jgi:hypothetical protein